MLKLVILVIAACVALAAAQNSTTVVVGSITCESLVPNTACYRADYSNNKVGEFCGYCRESDGTVHVFGCEDDATCEVDLTLSPPHGICHDITVKEIGDACDQTNRFEVCRQDHFDVSCITNGGGSHFCGGTNVYGPGQSCGTADMDTNVLQDGDACAYGDCVSNVCEGAASGESCTSKYCNAGLYCNENAVCTARIGIGATCALIDTNGHDETGGDNNGCAANADCVNKVCVEYYSVAAGGTCGELNGYWNKHVCEEGLACSYKSTTAYTCIDLPNEGNACDVTKSDSCGDYYTCVCNYDSNDGGSGVCIGEQNRIGDALRKGYACLVKNNCWFDLNWFIEGCVQEDCGTEAKAVVKEVDNAAKEVADLTGVPANSNSAFAVTISAIVLCAVALVL